MTAKTRRLLQALGFSSGLGLIAVAVTTYLTWPTNTLGNYLHDRRNREANVRALEMRVRTETDPLDRVFYQAWLAEEKGDLEGAIQGFQSLREGVQPGTSLHLKSSLRLGLAYGQNRQPERELQTYQALMDQYPGPSRLSQATFHLRQGDRHRALRLLDEALAQDARDGSLGSDRRFALYLQAIAGPNTPKASPRFH
jgi:tetratricopeptide (TPR) repeat protein